MHYNEEDVADSKTIQIAVLGEPKTGKVSPYLNINFSNGSLSRLSWNVLLYKLSYYVNASFSFTISNR